MKIYLLFFWAICGLLCTNYVAGKRNETNFKPTIEKKTRVLRISQDWLIDLEKSYAIGFPHQFGYLESTKNNFTVPNHNVPRNVNSKCQNVTFCSFEQNRRLMGRFGYESALNSTIHEMMDNPRARLFQFEDHWGEYEDYHFQRSGRMGMCSDLIKLGRKVKSITTFGKCVRLFEFHQCIGWSLAVYPGSSNSYRFEVPRHVRFQSIGPCLENEFSEGYLNQTMPGFVIKNPEMRSFQPDLVMFFDHDTDLGYLKDFGDVRVKFVLGPGNRTEIIQAKSPRRVFSLRPKTNVERRVFEKSVETEDGDVLGCAIPTILGGPGNASFNIFPANQFALSTWEDFILHNSQNNRNIGFFRLKFEYESENKTRPLFFYYRVFVLVGSVFQIHYGRIINEYKTNLRRAKPYCHVVSKFIYKGTAKINLRQVLKLHRNIPATMKSPSSKASIQYIKVPLDKPLINWNSCKQTNLRMEKDSKDNFTQSIHLKAQIRGMVKNPIVRLFNGENLTGDSNDFHSGQTRRSFSRFQTIYKGCYDLIKFYNQKIQSVETFGTCVRLFANGGCKGWSMSIYGKIPRSYPPIDTFLTRFYSVGPCLEDEFINATFSREIERQVVKDRKSSSYFPDIVQFGGFEWENKISYSRNVNYGLGPKNRIEYIDIFVQQVGPAQIPSIVNAEESEFYKSLDKKEGDVPCYAIPLELNGPANESFNIFPISQSKVDDWARIFRTSFSDPNEYFEFGMELRFVYENDMSTRPQFIYYRFIHEQFDKLRSSPPLPIYYGRFNNL